MSPGLRDAPRFRLIARERDGAVLTGRGVRPGALISPREARDRRQGIGCGAVAQAVARDTPHLASKRALSRLAIACNIASASVD